MQAQKKFEELKNERNTDKLNKGFGDLADMRASDPEADMRASDPVTL